MCLDYILRVCQSLWDSFLYLGKLHWFLYLLLSYFYDPGRVSFIDLVFPRNFRMIFLPHTNSVILLEPYCGTITEPGLPVNNTKHFLCPIRNRHPHEFLEIVW